MYSHGYRENERDNAVKRTKKKRRKKNKVKSGLLLLFITAIALIAVLVLSLTVFFKISNFKVVGNTKYTTDEILSAVDIKEGDNLFLASEAKISDALRSKLPFIDEVKIKRILPDTLQITVGETTEEVCFVSNGRFYTANTKGKIISEVASVPQNLIAFIVPDTTVFGIGKAVSFASERESELFNSYMVMISKNGYDVTSVNISDPYNSYMKYEDRLIVKFGSSSYFEEKADYFSASLSGIEDGIMGIYDLSGWKPQNNQPVLTYCDISNYE